MAIPLQDAIKTEAPKASDPRYDNDGLTWASIAEVNATIPLAERYEGLLVRINGVTHIYEGGIADNDLVPFTTGATLQDGDGLTFDTDHYDLGGVFTDDVNLFTLTRDEFNIYSYFLEQTHLGPEENYYGLSINSDLRSWMDDEAMYLFGERLNTGFISYLEFIDGRLNLVSASINSGNESGLLLEGGSIYVHQKWEQQNLWPGIVYPDTIDPANLTDYSIVYKKWVEDNFFSALANGEGTTSVLNSVNLGGTFNAEIDIVGKNTLSNTSYPFRVQTGFDTGSEVRERGFLIEKSHRSFSDAYLYFYNYEDQYGDIFEDYLELGFDHLRLVSRAFGEETSFNIVGGHITILGRSGFGGLKYDDDYHSNYDLRSLPDVEWVQDYVTNEVLSDVHEQQGFNKVDIYKPKDAFELVIIREGHRGLIIDNIKTKTDQGTLTIDWDIDGTGFGSSSADDTGHTLIPSSDNEYDPNTHTVVKGVISNVAGEPGKVEITVNYTTTENVI